MPSWAANAWSYSSKWSPRPLAWRSSTIPTDRSNVLVLKQLQESAPTLGLILQPLEVREPREFEGAFVAMTRERTHAMFGTPGALTFEHRKVLVDLAAKRRIPAMWGHRSLRRRWRPHVIRGEPVPRQNPIRPTSGHPGLDHTPAVGR